MWDTQNRSILLDIQCGISFVGYTMWDKLFCHVINYHISMEAVR